MPRIKAVAEQKGPLKVLAECLRTHGVKPDYDDGLTEIDIETRVPRHVQWERYGVSQDDFAEITNLPLDEGKMDLRLGGENISLIPAEAGITAIVDGPQREQWKAVGVYPATEYAEEECYHDHRTPEAAYRCGCNPETWECGQTPAQFVGVRCVTGPNAGTTMYDTDMIEMVIREARIEVWRKAVEQRHATTSDDAAKIRERAWAECFDVEARIEEAQFGR